MEERYPDDLEVAPKGDAHCQMCHDKIYKGDIRLKESRYDPKYHNVNSFVCHKCVKDYMKHREKRAKDLYLKMVGIPTLLDEMLKQNKKQIKINDGLRQKEKLVKQIEENNRREAWNIKHKNL